MQKVSCIPPWQKQCISMLKLHEFPGTFRVRFFRFLSDQAEERDSMEWDDRDPWFAEDKLQHVLCCFALTLLFSALANLAHYPFLRRHSILIGSTCSLLAGAAKEAADQLGFFRSAGASAKDGVADITGVLLASVALSLLGRLSRRKNEKRQDQGISLV